MPVVKTDPQYGSTSSINDWSFRKYHVELDRGGRNTGTFMTGEATLIAAGPPRLADMGESPDLVNDVIPIAVTENVSVNQNKMLQQIFEIGSRRSYFVSGHVTGSIGISRPMFNGPSLLRVLTGATKDGQALDTGPGVDPGSIRGAGSSTTGYNPDGIIRPNADDPQFYINLHAEIFDRPLGLLFFMIDQRNREYAKMYVEDAMIQAHAFNIASQAMTIAENVSLMFDRIVPVSIAESTRTGEAQ